MADRVVEAGWSNLPKGGAIVVSQATSAGKDVSPSVKRHDPAGEEMSLMMQDDSASDPTGTYPTTLEDRCIVSCGMLQPELTHLIESGFLNQAQVFFTPPGLHASPCKLEEHLLKRVAQAREVCPDHKIIVIYGNKCYIDGRDPLKRVDTILGEAGPAIVRVQGDYGYDMLAGFEDRQRITEGRQDKTLWFTPAWLRNWKVVYQRYLGWDRADANANFPGYYDKIVVLDGLGFEDEYISDHAEDILELFDWTGLEVDFEPITLDRFKGLLANAWCQPSAESTNP